MFEVSKECVESISFSHETSPLYIPVSDIFLHYISSNKHCQEIQRVLTRTFDHFFSYLSPPCTPHTIPRIERLGYRPTHHWAPWVSFPWSMLCPSRIRVHIFLWFQFLELSPLIIALFQCIVLRQEVPIMCIFKISTPVFCVSHFISRHFKWSISLLCGWIFLIPVICVFPVYRAHLLSFLQFDLHFWGFF